MTELEQFYGRHFKPDQTLREERLPELSGDLDSQAGTNLILLRFARGSLTLSNGANSNIALGDESFQKITGPTGVFSVTGFAGGNEGRPLFLFNSVAYAMTITNEATSTAANRITTLTGADVVLEAGTSFATFLYDGGGSRWILVSTGSSVTNPRWRKTTITHADLTTSSTTEDETLFSLGQFEKIDAISIKHSTAFTGGSLSAMTVSIGWSGSTTFYTLGHDIFQAVGDTIRLDQTGFSSATMASAGHSVLARFTATGDNVVDATAGSVDIWIRTGKME